MFNGFYVFIQDHDKLKNLSPSQLCDFQLNSEKKDTYIILDALQDYISKKGGTYLSLQTVYSTIKAFFTRNRASLPSDSFKIKATREPTKDNLTLQVVRDLVSVADLEMKALYLTLFAGLLDQERFQIFNKTHAQNLVTHLKEKGLDEPYKIEFSGRKASRNKTRFYTYLGHDALQAWQQYFERVRGYPKAGEAILLDSDKRPYSKAGLRGRHHRLLKSLGYITPEKTVKTRYGFGLHNFRDCVVTTLHYHKKEGFDKDTIQFFMGHITDKNNYDKFYRDLDEVKNEYLRMAPYLNLISESGGEKVTLLEVVKELMTPANIERFKALMEAKGPSKT